MRHAVLGRGKTQCQRVNSTHKEKECDVELPSGELRYSTHCLTRGGITSPLLCSLMNGSETPIC